MIERMGVLAAVLATMAVASGCSSEDRTGWGCAHEICDIAEEGCVRQASEAVACDLGVDAIYPLVRRLTRAELLAEWEGESEPLDEDALAAQADIFRAQSLVGLIPAGYEPAQASADALDNFVAFYTYASKDIVILEDVVLEEDARYYVLVHELVHAYQDAERDLASVQEEHGYTATRSLGLSALIEGEAVYRTDLASLEVEGIRANDVDWQTYSEDFQDAMLELARESDTPALDVRGLFPYAWGLAFVQRAAAGEQDMAALYAQPPDSVRQTMGGYLGWPDQLKNEDVIFDPTAAPVMPAEYEALTLGHVSVWILNAVLSRTAVESFWLTAVNSVPAETVTYLRHRPTSGVAVVWRIRSYDAEHLREVLDSSVSDWEPASEEGTGALVYGWADSDLVLVAASEELDAREVHGAISGWQSPEEAFPQDDAMNPFGGYSSKRTWCGPVAPKSRR